MTKAKVNALVALGVALFGAAAVVGSMVESTYTRLAIGLLMIFFAVAAATDMLKPVREAYWAHYGKPKGAESNLRAVRVMAIGYGALGVVYIVAALS